ncbi:hypothetical protein ABG79_01465 [Caloramator mitchellensis]|uniref:Uncharacterized protein n=1 Tax=Caloramator mitchellensis TaxID=908809 RepID=A0A0R3JT69_CALMK|nr:hypothetical protein [Caloramator mitchellensis]KRQ86713.1 hypothetical protein ABG79_01465 [Caloramator mitchellensis]
MTKGSEPKVISIRWLRFRKKLQEIVNFFTRKNNKKEERNKNHQTFHDVI